VHSWVVSASPHLRPSKRLLDVLALANLAGLYTGSGFQSCEASTRSGASQEIVTALILKFDLAQLRQSTPWRAGNFTFRAAPGRNAETDAGQNCNRAADATPRSGVVRKNQRGHQSEI
jgi:hypothetical protein